MMVKRLIDESTCSLQDDHVRYEVDCPTFLLARFGASLRSPSNTNMIPSPSIFMTSRHQSTCQKSVEITDAS